MSRFSDAQNPESIKIVHLEIYSSHLEMSLTLIVFKHSVFTAQ